MQLDPDDFCTFWFTSEYYTSTNLTFNWQTRVGAFKFPTCVSPARGTLSGTVTYCQGGAPIVGAVISVSDGHGGVTDSLGHYSITLPPGSYTVSATDPAINCGPSSSQNVTISNGVTTPANFCLTGTPLIDLFAASFDDSAGNNNGVINRNECFKVIPTLKNDGCFAENGISAVLSTSTPGVVVDQAFSTYPNLAINASAVNDTPYRAHTTPSFVCGTPIVFSLNETGSLGGPRQFQLQLPVLPGSRAIVLRDPGQHRPRGTQRTHGPQRDHQQLRRRQGMPGRARRQLQHGLRHHLVRQHLGRHRVPDHQPGCVELPGGIDRRRLRGQLRWDKPVHALSRGRWGKRRPDFLRGQRGGRTQHGPLHSTGVAGCVLPRRLQRHGHRLHRQHRRRLRAPGIALTGPRVDRPEEQR
jgi:hypothetical protein